MRAISCCGSNPERLNEILADPIVQMLMRADHITEEQIRALTGAISSGAGAAAGEGPGAMGAAGESGTPRGSCRKARSRRERSPARPLCAN